MILKNMGMEIEKKWIPDKAFAERLMGMAVSSEIEQGYLCFDPVIRVRRDGSSFYMTYKGKGLLEREEYNLPLNQEAYEGLLSKCDGAVIEKERYRIPFSKVFPDRSVTGITGPEGGLLIELDVFHGRYEGLQILELEFADRTGADSFSAPAEFGKDVTGQKEYTNAFMAAGDAGSQGKGTPAVF